MLVFEETEKPEYPEKNLSEQRREPTTNFLFQSYEPFCHCLKSRTIARCFFSVNEKAFDDKLRSRYGLTLKLRWIFQINISRSTANCSQDNPGLRSHRGAGLHG